MLSGRGLCNELITCPEEFYRLCCVVYDLETSNIACIWLQCHGGEKKKNIYIYI